MRGQDEKSSSATRTWWSGISGGRVAISVAEQNATSPPPPGILKLLTVVLKTSTSWVRFGRSFCQPNRISDIHLQWRNELPLSLALQSFELSDGSVAFALVSVSVTEYSMEILPFGMLPPRAPIRLFEEWGLPRIALMLRGSLSLCNRTRDSN